MPAMAAGVLWLLFLASSILFSGVLSDELALVGQSTALQVVPKVSVRNSPGVKPGACVLAERVRIYGLSRMKNLKKISHSVTVKVSQANSSLRQPYVEVCFHRNLSLSLGMCPQSQWLKLSKGSWARKMSPFDHKILDIRMASSSGEALDLSIEEEFLAYRIVFLVVGTLLYMVAPTLSESLLFYYSSAMAIGVILLILIVLFQGMKLLPTGRGNSLAIFTYSSLVGIGSFLLRYVPQLLQTVLADFGISEDMYTPLAIFSVLFFSLAGAWLGFWVVRKLILTEDGLIDTTVSQFVAWSIRIVSAVMILQCSLDPLVAAQVLAFAILVSSILRKAAKPRCLRRLYRRLRRAARKGHQKSLDYDSSPADGLMEKSPPSESETFYSTYHSTPQRRKFSDEEWKAFTKECTKKGLEELVSSPDFSRWAVAHAERITLAPIEEHWSSGRWHRWFSWFR